MEIHYRNNGIIDLVHILKGNLSSPELNKKNSVCIKMVSPQEFPHITAGIWSPEHLFVAAICGCLKTTFFAIAKNSMLQITSFSCKAEGRMELVEGEFIMSKILLKPLVVIPHELYRSKTMRILKKAKDACHVARSVESKINLEIIIKDKSILLESN